MRIHGNPKGREIPLTMIRPHLENIPEATLPAPYRIRPFQSGDEKHWAFIEWKAGEFPDQASAERHFQREFGQHADEMHDRCFLLEDGQGLAIGTTTAWYNTLQGEPFGRIHWVAIIPEHQGRGLAKPLLSHAMKRLARTHNKAYLTTQTTSWKAIQMYLQFGFEPWMIKETCREGWIMMEKWLQRRLLGISKVSLEGRNDER